MKFKEWMNKERLIMGGIVIGILGIGTIGMIYAVQKDQDLQKNKVETVVLSTTRPEENQVTDKIVQEESKPSVAEYELIYDESEKQLKTVITMEQAAEIGIDYIQKETALDLACSQVEMSHVDLNGVLERVAWKGKIEDETRLCIFTVGATSGKVLEMQDYYREEENGPWITKLDNERIQQWIDHEILEVFQKVEIDLSCDMKVQVVASGLDYALDMEYFDDDYKITYEVRNDTLFIKDEKKSNSKKVNSDLNQITLYIPEKVQLEAVKLSSDIGSNEMKYLNAKTIEIVSDTGTIELSSVKTEQLKVGNDTGTIDIEDSQADVLNLSNDTGQIWVKGSKIGKLNAEDLGVGPISLKDSEIEKGKVTLDTGAIELLQVNGKEMSIQTGTGAINVQQAQFDTLNLLSDTGCIYLGKGLKGNIVATTEVGMVNVEEPNNTACTYQIESGLNDFINNNIQEEIEKAMQGAWN